VRRRDWQEETQATSAHKDSGTIESCFILTSSQASSWAKPFLRRSEGSCVHNGAAREIPRPAGEDARHRDDVQRMGLLETLPTNAESPELLS